MAIGSGGVGGGGGRGGGGIGGQRCGGSRSGCWFTRRGGARGGGGGGGSRLEGRPTAQWDASATGKEEAAAAKAAMAGKEEADRRDPPHPLSHRPAVDHHRIHRHARRLLLPRCNRRACVQCHPCADRHQIHPLFDPSASATYSSMSFDAEPCRALDIFASTSFPAPPVAPPPIWTHPRPRRTPGMPPPSPPTPPPSPPPPATRPLVTRGARGRPRTTARPRYRPGGAGDPLDWTANTISQQSQKI